MLALVQILYSFSKYFIEDSVFGEGGNNFPTTDMLLLKGGLISLERKERIRNKLTRFFNITLASSIDNFWELFKINFYKFGV